MCSTQSWRRLDRELKHWNVTRERAHAFRIPGVAVGSAAHHGFPSFWESLSILVSVCVQVTIRCAVPGTHFRHILNLLQPHLDVLPRLGHGPPFLQLARNGFDRGADVVNGRCFSRERACNVNSIATIQPTQMPVMRGLLDTYASVKNLKSGLSGAMVIVVLVTVVVSGCRISQNASFILLSSATSPGRRLGISSCAAACASPRKRRHRQGAG